MQVHSSGKNGREREESEMALKIFDELQKYLCSSIFTQVGPVTAKSVVSAFGPRTIYVIERSSHELYGVRGVGNHRAEAIIEGWTTQRHLRKECMILLRKGGNRAIWNHDE